MAPARSHDFALLWIGQGLSLLGTYASWIAWIWLLTELTGSTALIGLVLAAYSLPAILLMLPAGVWVDRYDPRRIALWSEASSAVLGLVFAVLVTLDRISLATFVAFAILFGVGQAFINPALSALFPAIVRPHEFHAANSLRQASIQCASLIGPPLGGFLIAKWSIGIALAFDAATFALSAFVILCMQYRHANPGSASARAAVQSGASTARRFTIELLSGVRFLVSQSGMLTIILLFSITNALNNVEAVSVPVLARSDLGLSAAEFGFLGAFLGVGGLLGALAIGALGARVRHSAIIICGSMAVFGATIAAMGSARGAWGLYVMYVLIGLSSVVPEIVSATLWQQLVPRQMRGRVFSLLGTIAMAVNPVGFLFAGAIGEMFGVRQGLQIGGATIFCLSLLTLIVPSVRRIDQQVFDTTCDDLAVMLEKPSVSQ
jgi:MFS family permease